jgi:hypothetical protein
MKKREFKTGLDDLMVKHLTPEQIDSVKKRVQENILRIRLADLRRQMNVKQSDVEGFTQPAVASLERRRDMKISTLAHYLNSIGMSMEIHVQPRERKAHIPDDMVLLKA